MRQRILGALKTIWVVAILAAFAWYLVTNWAEFSAYAARVGLAWIAVSVLLLVLSKLVLAVTATEALRGVPFRLPYLKSLWIYSLSQLGRYIPGSIWHYLGRIAFYKAEGVATKRGVAALLIESLWLLGTAAAVGVALTVPQLLDLVGVVLAPGLQVALAALVLAVWLAAMVFGTRVLGRRLGLQPMRAAVAAALQAIVWLSLGLAFWTIFPPEMRTADTLVPAVGAFALAWAIGYVVPFAPAGLGIREGVILALLSGLLEPSGAAAAAAMSRLLFTGVELGLGALGSALYKRRPAEESGDDAAPAA